MGEETPKPKTFARVDHDICGIVFGRVGEQLPAGGLPELGRDRIIVDHERQGAWILPHAGASKSEGMFLTKELLELFIAQLIEGQAGEVGTDAR